MEIDFTKLLEVDIPEDIQEWMQKHASNHQKMLKTWNTLPEDSEYLEYYTVLLCLAYELQKENPVVAVATRLLGKARVLRKNNENLKFNEILHGKD